MDNNNIDIKDTFGIELFLNTDIDVKLKGKLALAQTIQNLLILEPGTMPNDPEMGIGIGNEQFESYDDTYLDNIKSNIESQLDRYIVTDYSVTVEVKTKQIDTVKNINAIYVILYIKDQDYKIDVKLDDTSIIDLIFLRDVNGKLVSRVKF